MDDDVAILRSVRRALEARDFRVETLVDGNGLEAKVNAFQPDVLLLDLVLPDRDGIEITRSLRISSTFPILVLSAVGDDMKKVEALDEGADDYLTKPFSMEELLARIRVLLRRSAGQAKSTELVVEEISLDVASHAVSVAGTPVHLTPKEFELLRLLMQERGRILTQRTILARIWGPEYVNDAHVLRTFVHQVRSKLEAASPGVGALIINDPGVGYRITAKT